MKKIILLFWVFAYLPFLFAQDLPVELQTPEVVSVNRLPMRASAFAFENLALAERCLKESSANFLQACRESIAGVRGPWKNTEFHSETSNTVTGWHR